MTSRERVLCTVRGEQTDCVPLHIDVHPSYLTYDPAVARWSDQFERTDDLLALGTDPMIEVWLPDPCCHPDVRVTAWRDDNTSDGAPILYRAYETPAGTLRQAIRETPDLYDWHKINRNTVGPLADPIDGVGLLEDVNPSRSVEYLVNGPEDLRAMEYLFMPPEGEALQQWREAALYAKAQAQSREVCLLARRLYAGSATLWLTDAQETIIALAENPGYVERLLGIIQQWQTRMLDLALDLGVDMVTRFGYYDTPDFWGLQFFERFLRRPMDREAEACEQAGAYLCQQQSKGLTQQAEVYRKMKVHILRDLDPVQGEEDMGLLKQKLGGDKTLMGGINCDVLLANATREEVDELVLHTIDLMSPGGRFIMHLVPGVYAGVPWQKVQWLVDSWKEHA